MRDIQIGLGRYWLINCTQLVKALCERAPFENSDTVLPRLGFHLGGPQIGTHRDDPRRLHRRPVIDQGDRDMVRVRDQHVGIAYAAERARLFEILALQLADPLPHERVPFAPLGSSFISRRLIMS